MEKVTKSRRVKVRCEDNALVFETSKDKERPLVVRFQRTLRLPDDSKTYPLPPSLGNFPVRKVDDFKDRVPASWRERGGIFIPMYQREALWMSFTARTPHAVKVAAGKIDAVTGEAWSDTLVKQNYMVAPPQPWLDGFKTGKNTIRQFVAMPLGMGYTAEGQITGEETFGGIQFQVYPATAGRFPPPPYVPRVMRSQGACGQSLSCGSKSIGSSTVTPTNYSGGITQIMSMNCEYERGVSFESAEAEMGLGLGGKMEQKIYEDPYGIETWDQTVRGGRIFVHIVNSALYHQITGEAAPASPIKRETYLLYNYPWFEVYDEGVPAVAGSDKLKELKTVAQMDEKHGFKGVMDNKPMPAPKTPRQKKKKDKNQVRDGSW